MTPRNDLRYVLPDRGLAFEASWARPQLPTKDRIRGILRCLLLGGPAPGSLEQSVSREAFLAAIELVEAQDVESARKAFADLGYDVRVSAMR